MSTSKKAAPRKQATPPAAEAPNGRDERFIVLLRHGVAEEPTADRKDEDRGLTAQGHARMKEIARGLERVLPRAQAIYTSPYLRAVQTSLWVSKGYRSRVEIHTRDGLAPGAGTKAFLALVRAIEERRVIIVGHEPDLTAGLRALVGLQKGMELKKGGCFGVRLFADGTAALEWLLTPRILRRLGE